MSSCFLYYRDALCCPFTPSNLFTLSTAGPIRLCAFYGGALFGCQGSCLGALALSTLTLYRHYRRLSTRIFINFYRFSIKPGKSARKSGKNFFHGGSFLRFLHRVYTDYTLFIHFCRGYSGVWSWPPVPRKSITLYPRGVFPGKTKTS